MLTTDHHEGLLARGKFIFLFFVVFLICVAAKGQTYSSKTGHARSIPPSQPSSNCAVADQTGHLARITAYWPGEDYFTTRRRSATGVRLRLGYCAVDSRIIPYGSVVKIPGLGNYLAVDTGTAVKNRKAARESGHTAEERAALVIDLFFPSRKAGEAFSAQGPKFAMVAWENGSVASD